MDLIRGILTNRERYGDDYCPYRLVTDDKDIDLEIVCPCIFRDIDMEDFGQCFCALYVSQEWIDQGEEKQIPDLWLPEDKRTEKEQDTMNHSETLQTETTSTGEQKAVALKGVTTWHCTVCGYLAIRPKLPVMCPVCGAKRDRFTRLNLAFIE